MLLTRAVDRWKALSLCEQAVWVLIAWLLWSAMGLGYLLRAVDPPLAVDGLAVRQLMTNTLPGPRRGEFPGMRASALPWPGEGKDPWDRPWGWEERWSMLDPRASGSFERKGWYFLVDRSQVRSGDKERPHPLSREVQRGAGRGWRAVEGPRSGALQFTFWDGFGVSASAEVDAALYSPGPNQLDEGGAGDDVVAREPSVPALLAAWNREIGLTLAVFLLWLVPWLRLRRSPRLAPELAKTLLVAAPAIALIAWLLVRATKAGGTLPLERLLGVAPLVPWQLAVGGSLGLAVFLAALVLRLSRPLAEAGSAETSRVAPEEDPLL